MKVLFTILLSTIVSASHAQYQSMNIEQHIANFYSYYFMEMDNGINKAVNNDTLKKYFITSFIKSIPDQVDKCEYDPITQTQDYDQNWTKSLTVARSGDDSEYNVCFVANKQYCFKVILLKEVGQMKISNVLYIDD